MTAARLSRERWSKQVLVIVTGLSGLVAVAIDPAPTLALSLVALTAWLGWTRSPVGLGLIAATIPLQDAATLTVAGASLTMTRLVLVPFVIGWAVAWLLGRARLPVTAPVVAWGLVVAALGVSVVAVVDRGAWAQEVYRWGIALALYLIAVNLLRRADDLRPVLVGTAAGVLGCVAVATWQVATGAGPATFKSGGVTRAYGFFGEPNPLAAYLEMTVLLMLPLGLALAMRPARSLWHRYGLLVIAGLGGGALLLTQSRGGLLGFAAGAMVVALLLNRLTRTLVLLGIILALPVVTVVPAGRAGLERFTASVTAVTATEQVTPANWSVQERVAHWKAGLKMLETSPLTGVGAGNFDDRYREMTTVWRFRIPRGHAHHSALQLGAQAGYTGLIAYLVLLFMVGARILRGVLYARRPNERALAIGALGVLVAVIVHGQFDYLHGLSLNLAFALALASAEPAIRSIEQLSHRQREIGAIA